MLFELKIYQKKTLEALEKFLGKARIFGLEQAFAECKPDDLLDQHWPSYKKMERLEDIPYVCLRLPTGGGKTVLASYSIAAAAKSYLEQDYPVVLWLVPSNTIREQTLEVLRNHSHPCREVIDDAFEGRVSVFDISEIEQIRPHDLTERVCVIVGTIATLRVTNTEGRKIYAHNENFESHFSRITQSTPGLEVIEDGQDKGKTKFSFANLLHIHRPLIIMDEAHNARTPLTFEVLQRVSPACIIEYTATPDEGKTSGSNVLYRASASELKTEDMIKLPIMLSEHNNWQETIRDTVLTRVKLSEKAKEEKDFIRPIVLIQAESKDREVTVEVVKQHLIENEKIEGGRIAIATGKQRELDGINLFDPNCKIEYVITIEALKEGWDCSFAYVFCSVANIHSSKDVEQLLGRVLRMPYAKKRQVDELNKAYAHISSPTFAQAARHLHDCLVDMGFEEEEIDTFVQHALPSLTEGVDKPLALYHTEPLVLMLSETPDLSYLATSERGKIEVTEIEAGKVQIAVKGEITEELADHLVNAVPKAQQEEIKTQIIFHRKYSQRSLSPAEQGKTLSVPALCVWTQGELELVEKELFLDVKGWNLFEYPQVLSEAEFSVNEAAHTFEFDLQGKKVVYGLVDNARQLDLSDIPTAWTDFELSRWMDKQVRQPDIRQEVMLEFIRRIIAYLLNERKFGLAALVRCKYPLAKVIAEKIKDYRQQAYCKGYQETLFGPESAVETSYDFAVKFNADNYSANWYYKGSYKFQKHFYTFIGELESSGEEFDCAKILDSLSQVRYWVRNVAGSKYSFWLPTSSDKFYPDFIAELNDGRILIVEYKGSHIIDSPDSKEKRNIGELWEEKSKGNGLFIMAEKKDSKGRDTRKQLMDKIGG